MKKLIMICLVMIAILAISGAAQAGTLWSQPWSGSGWAAYNACAAYDSRPADDFMLASTSDIESITFWGGRRVDVPVVDGFRIQIFEDVYDSELGHHRAVDTPMFDSYVSGNGGQTPAAGGAGEVYLYNVDLPTPVRVMAGDTYWIGIQADTKSDPAYPWWGWYVSNTQNLSAAEYNDGGMSHHPINESPFSGYDYDFSYELTGTPVPEPTTICLLGLGALSLLRKRK